MAIIFWATFVRAIFSSSSSLILIATKNVNNFLSFSVHILFDDAFELSDDNDEYQVVNRFVKQFVEVIDTAASYVHQCDIKLHPPSKYPTPYGGKLEYILPGGNKLFVHMKDKIKIRHRKRWSQVS